MTASPVACVIPALNAAPTLGRVVAALRAAVPGVLSIVVDDGSTDDTRGVAAEVADVPLHFPRNRGKGAALRAGFEVALSHGVDVVLTVDADGQHDPRCAPSLLRALDCADLAIGARDHRALCMPIGRRVTNRLSASAVSRCIGRPVADAQSGFRAARAGVVRDVKPTGDRYDFETEFLIRAARRGYRLAFVPIPTVYDNAVPSQFRPIRDSVRIIGTLWRFGRGAQA